MAFFFNGATHVLSRSGAALQTWPLTIHGLIRLTANNDGLDHCILGFWESGANNGFRLMVARQAGSMKVRVATKASGAASSASSTTAISDLNWHSAVGEITAANARQCWLDNAGNGSGTTSLTPGTLTKTTIGAQDSGGTIDSNIGHELANVAAWAGTLTADERAALAAGVSPLLIRPDILVLYLPGIRDAVDYMDAPFSVTGATVVDHPRVYMPSRAQQLVKTAVGGTTYNDTLTSTATATDGVTIVATFAPALTETATGADTITALATFNATLSQGVTATDNYIGGSIFNDTLTQSATAGDSVTNLITFNPTLTEAATGGDSFAVIATFAAAYSDSATAGFSLSDGSAASIWTTIAPASGTWGEQPASTGIWTTLPPSTGTWT